MHTYKWNPEIIRLQVADIVLNVACGDLGFQVLNSEVQVLNQVLNSEGRFLIPDPQWMPNSSFVCLKFSFFFFFFFYSQKREGKT